MTPLRIIAIMDGRPGHEKQTQGVIQAMGKKTPVTVSYRSLPSLSLAATLRSWCAYLANVVWKPMDANANVGADMVIGTGSHTHVPVLLLKQQTGAKAVTCMTPMYPLKLNFDLCLVPSHDRPGLAENVFMTTGPPGIGAPKGTPALDSGLVLIGGIDEKSHTWNTEATLDQLTQILDRTADYHWTISSSPRTPADTVARLRELAAAYPGTSFYDAKDTPRGWIETQYSQNRIAWVTADSISMVYEALGAGCGVGILPVSWKHPENKFQTSIDDLYASGLAISFDRWLAGDPIPVIHKPLNEADRCAAEILRRWWPERLEI